MATKTGNIQVKTSSGKANFAPNTITTCVADPGRGQALSASLENLIEKNALGYPTFSTLSNYPVGGTVFYDRKLWTFTTAHSAGAWNASHVREANIKELLIEAFHNIGGDVIIQDNLTVGGVLRASGIKQPNCGLFSTLAKLQAAYPIPEVGMWATVGDTIPGEIYVCETAGVWTDSGRQGGSDPVDLTEIEERLDGIFYYQGVATPETDPGTPDQNVFYFAGAGTYTQFGDTQAIPQGSFGVFAYNGTWTTSIIELTAAGAVLYTPQTLTDEQKVQARTNIGLGDGTIDTTPTAGSHNLVASWGVNSFFWEFICKQFGDTHNVSVGATTPVYVCSVNPNEKHFLFVKASDAAELNNTGIYSYHANAQSTLYQHLTRDELIKGIAVEFIPDSTTVGISVRTSMTGTNVELYVLSESAIRGIVDEIYRQVIAEDSLSVTITGVTDISFTLKQGVRYILYAQSDSALNATSAGWYDTVSLAKLHALPSNISTGDVWDYTPSNDVKIGIRSGVANVTLNYKICSVLDVALSEIREDIQNNTTTLDEMLSITPLHNYWENKIVAGYGDSITAHAGNDYSQPWDNFPTTGGKAYSWVYYVAREFNFAAYKGRGVGSQGYSWNTKSGLSGGSVVFYESNTGITNSRNDNYDLDTYEGDVPAGCVAGRGSFCSWDRITKSFPAAIKETIDIVLIMGGTNDPEWDTELQWVDNDVTDPEWAASTYYSLINGDYNIGTMQGGLASTIMKLQLWMPNAMLVLMTPSPNNHPTAVSIVGLKSLVTTSYQKSESIRKIAHLMSIPLIDINAEMGVNGLNAATYLADGVHPSNIGKKMLAKVIIGELKRIPPRDYVNDGL